MCGCEAFGGGSFKEEGEIDELYTVRLWVSEEWEVDARGSRGYRCLQRWFAVPFWVRGSLVARGICQRFREVLNI